MLYDADIRDGLCAWLEERIGKVRFFDELTMGRSRADLVMVTESFIAGIEIKSDADSYARLARQVKDYDRYFDLNIIACGGTHALHAGEHVPEHWGIVSVDEIGGAPDFYEVREAVPVPQTRGKLKRQLSLLWRRELTAIQRARGLHIYAGKSRTFVEDYILKSMDPEELRKDLLETLLQRDYTLL